MNLKKLKGWLRRIATVEGPKESEIIPKTDDQAVRGLAERSRPARHIPDRHPGPPGEAPPPDGERTVAQPPAPKVRTRPLTRQGIPLLNPNEDLAHHFLAGDLQDEAPPESPLTRNARRGPAAQRSAAKDPRTAPRCNRAGVRQLDGHRDLRDYFLPSAVEKNTPERRSTVKTESGGYKGTGRKPNFAAKTDRHGIPRLDDQTDLHLFFEAAQENAEDTAADRDLGEVFRASLDHDAHRLMKKKTGGFFTPRRLSLKEKLRRYPAPQAQLDLHGDTALIARQRADNFLRTAGAAGTLTVRIIVGKGLHSESGAVLPDVIEDLLVALKRDDHVLTFHWEKGIKRKSGAVIVYLETPF